MQNTTRRPSSSRSPRRPSALTSGALTAGLCAALLAGTAEAQIAAGWASFDGAAAALAGPAAGSFGHAPGVAPRVAPQQGRTQEVDFEDGLDQAETRAMIQRYEKAEHWSLKGIILTRLAPTWHPSADAILIDALGNKDKRLAALALEALVATPDQGLSWAMTPELIETLIDVGLKQKSELYQQRAESVLKRVFPGEEAEGRSKWKSAWRKIQKDGYAPAEWIAPGEKEVKTGSSTVVERAINLQKAGLEICFVIDGTGSMQDLINAVGASATRIGEVLQGFAPEMRLALVVYRDFDDVDGGCEVITPLEDKIEKVFKRIQRVFANGGGDFPEAVYQGLEQALSVEDIGWTPEANKLVVIMGDAPPHGKDIEPAVKLAEQASQDGWVRSWSVKEARRTKRGAPTTGKRPADLRPFVIAAIATGTAEGVNGQTSQVFGRIAEAGGGMSTQLQVGENADAAVNDICRSIVRMSFGRDWREPVDRFLDVYFEYQADGLYE